MEKHFANILEENTVKVNHDIVNGLACSEMLKGEQYLDRVLRLVAKTFPEGVTYDYYERCSPYEEFEETTRPRDAGRVFDLAPSNIYVIKLHFSFKGKKLLHRYLYLPYVEEGGIITLNGSRFHVTPVFSDKVISPGRDNLFVRILQNRLKFRRLYHTVTVDGIKDSMYVVWGQIYRKPKIDNNKVPITTKASTTVAHYLFSIYGFSGAFSKYAGFVPVIGQEDINEDSYPNTDWIICKSAHGETTHVKPNTFMGNYYHGTNIRLAIRKDKWNEITKGLVAGFYYIVDHFPDKFNTKSLDNKDNFIILMGHILYSGTYGYDHLYHLMNNHLSSLDGYLDEIAIDKLRERNFHVSDFYDLLALLIEHFNALVTDTDNLRSSVYGKSLEILYYMFYNTTENIIKTRFSLVKLANKRPLTEKDVNDTLKKRLNKRSVFKLTSDRIITETLEYSGDNKFVKITSKMTEQESLPGATKGKSKHAGASDGMMLNSSMTEAGNILYLGKTNCIPTNRVNAFVNMDDSSRTILPNPKYIDIIKRAEDLLTGKISLTESDVESIESFRAKLDLANNSNIVNGEDIILSEYDELDRDIISYGGDGDDED